MKSDIQEKLHESSKNWCKINTTDSIEVLIAMEAWGLRSMEILITNQTKTEGPFLEADD
jgi:hypothetical protein